MTSNERVRAAILATPVNYLEKCFEIRNPGTGAMGSRFCEEQSPQDLMDANWVPSTDNAIQAPAVGFITGIRGITGMLMLNDLDPTRLSWELALVKNEHSGDADLVRYVSAEEFAKQSDLATFTTILLGPNDEQGGIEVVWAFFPGGAVPPMPWKAVDAVLGPITFEQARVRRYRYAKLMIRG